MLFKSFALTALFAAAPLVSASGGAGKQKPAQPAEVGPDTVHGCYSSMGSMKLAGSDEFQSQGKCASTCRAMQKPVGATQVEKCYCGDTYPPKSTLTKDSACGEPCGGFGDDACGGLNAWTVYNIGIRRQVADDPDPTTSSSKAPAEATTTVPAAVTTVPAAPTPSNPDDSDSGNKSNTVGIAVGVVVGLLALAAIGGGAFFFYRRKRNAEIEEEHRRNAAVNAFISSGKPPSSSGGLSLSDQRLDPVMAQRRMSSGSIADNEDYSRRILRVTNA